MKLGRLKYVFNLGLMSKTFTVIFIMRGSTCVASSLCSVYIWLPFFQKRRKYHFHKAKGYCNGLFILAESQAHVAGTNFSFIVLGPRGRALLSDGFPWMPFICGGVSVACADCTKIKQAGKLWFEKLSQDLGYFLRSFSSLTLFFKDNIRIISCSGWTKKAHSVIFSLKFKYFLRY